MNKDDNEGGGEAASWEAVLLVCKACRKRSSGPKGIRTKDVVAEARRLVRTLRPRPRVLTTSCLGLCPKAAVAVAVVGGGQVGGARLARVDSPKRMERLLPLLAPFGSKAD